MTLSTVLSILREGKTIIAAAAAVGTYVKAISRYADRHPEFQTAMDHAIAEGRRATLIAEGAESLPAELPDLGEVSQPPHRGPPRPDTVDAAEALCVDVDLVASVDASVPIVPGLPPLTMLNVLAFHWTVMHDRKEAPILRKSSSEFITAYSCGTAMAAQQRRNARAEREEAPTVIDVSASDSDEPTTGEGMVFLELPSNGSEAPGHGPRPIDAEVVQ